MDTLSSDLIGLIYSYDNTYREIYSNCIKEITYYKVRRFINRKKVKKCYICNIDVIRKKRHLKSKKHLASKAMILIKLLDINRNINIYNIQDYLKNHELLMENSKEILNYMRSRLT